MDQNEISDIPEISGAIEIDMDVEVNRVVRRVTISVVKRGDKFFAHYYLHPKDSDQGAPKIEGLVFSITEDICTSQELPNLRRRVKEEADARGIGHVRHLGF